MLLLLTSPDGAGRGHLRPRHRHGVRAQGLRQAHAVPLSLQQGRLGRRNRFSLNNRA